MTTQQQLSPQELVDYYSDAIDQQKSSAALDKFMAASPEFFDELAELVADDSSYLSFRFQSLIERQFVEYSLLEIMSSAPLAMQNGLDIKRIASLWTDKAVGLPQVGVMFDLPVIAVRPSGEKILVSGNHRIAALVYPLVAAGIDPEALCNTMFQVQQISINIEQLEEFMSVDGKKPARGDVINQANNILFASWWGFNQTRRPQKSEYQDAEAFRLDVDVEDNGAVLDAAFSDVKKIDLLTAAKHLVTNWLVETASTEGTLLNYDQVATGSVPVLFNIKGEEKTVTSTTLSNILKSFLAAVRGLYEERPHTKRDGTATVKKIKYWSEDLKYADSFDALCEFVAGNLESVIDSYLNSLDPEDEYNSNIARNQTAIGKAMAEHLDNVTKPMYDPRAKSEASTTKVKPAKSLGLRL